MINVKGICHSYAFARCCSKQQQQSFTDPSALNLDPVIMQNTQSIRDVKLGAPGIITVVRLGANPQPFRCVHSYYIQWPGLTLHSVNDPIMGPWRITSASNVIDCPLGRKDAIQYNLAEIFMRREGGNWELDGVQVDFRYASESSVQQQWWS